MYKTGKSCCTLWVVNMECESISTRPKNKFLLLFGGFLGIVFPWNMKNCFCYSSLVYLPTAARFDDFFAIIFAIFCSSTGFFDVIGINFFCCFCELNLHSHTFTWNLLGRQCMCLASSISKNMKYKFEKKNIEIFLLNWRMRKNAIYMVKIRQKVGKIKLPPFALLLCTIYNIYKKSTGCKSSTANKLSKWR